MHTVTERTFYSGTDSRLPYVVKQHSAFQLPHPPSIPGLINGALVAVEIENRLRHLAALVGVATVAYQSQQVHGYFFTVEAVLLSMRRVIDDLVMSLYCRSRADEVASTRRIEIDGYGALFRSGKPTSFGTELIREYIHPNEEIADVLVELSNSYKHSYLLAEARAWGVEFPSVLAIHAPRNDYSKPITYHNHSLGQLVIGFNALVEGIVQRSKGNEDTEPNAKRAAADA
jgi:hypothetical protein